MKKMNPFAEYSLSSTTREEGKFWEELVDSIMAFGSSSPVAAASLNHLSNWRIGSLSSSDSVRVWSVYSFLIL